MKGLPTPFYSDMFPSQNYATRHEDQLTPMLTYSSGIYLFFHNVAIH